MFKRRDRLENPAFGDAHCAIRPEAHQAKLLGPKGIPLGYYRVPGHRQGLGEPIRYNGDGGLITVAPARVGKFRDVLAAALMDPGQSDRSAIVIDPKGELAAVTAAQRRRMGQDVAFLNPYNVWPSLLGSSARYNPMKLLDPSSPDWAADCRKLAEGLIAPNHTDKGAQHWIDGARGLLTGVIGGLVAHGAEETQNLAEVREIICDDNLLLRYAKASKNSPHAFIRQELSSYALKEPYNAGEISSFKQNARVQTSFLGLETMAENLRGHDFRFAVLKEKPTTTYIILPDNRMDICSRWFRLVIASALDDLWRGGKGKCPVLAILDEMAAIGHLDVLASAAATAAGRGIQLWPIYQNVPQIKKDYGEVWETFLSGSEIQMFFGGPRDQTTADHVSKQAGTRTVITAGQSVNNTGPLGQNNKSDNEGQTGQPLIRPHEVRGLGPNESIIFGPRNIVINALRIPYFDTPGMQGLYDPNPMHENDPAPPPPVDPDTIVTFADALVESEERAERARHALRPLSLRLLMWGHSPNRTLNAFYKIQYAVTLPIRLVLALLALPFAIHNRPLRAIVGFFALFGFYEIWDGVAKRPLMSLYQTKVMEYRAESVGNPSDSMAILNSNYKAAKWLLELPFEGFGASKENKPDIPPSRTKNLPANGATDDAVKRLSDALAHQTREAAGKADQYADAYLEEQRREIMRGAMTEHDARMARNVAEAQQLEEIRQKYQAAIDAGECDQTGKPSCEDYQSRLRASVLK